MTVSNDPAPSGNTPAPVADPPAAPTQTATPDGSTVTPDPAPAANPAPTDPPADPPADGPVVPETYVFDLPEGVTLDEKLAERASPVLRELNLTNEQANKLATVFAEYQQELVAGSQEQLETYYQDRRTAEAAERLGSDLEALRADKEVGGPKFDGVRHAVMRFIEAEGTPEFTALVDSLGIANNPEFVRVIHRALHASPIDTGAAGTATAPGRSAAASIWPHLPSAGG